MSTITRKLEFDAGHRVLGHEGKCRHIHGHRYVAEITVSSKILDNLGRVVDFSVIKTKVGGWIDDQWDHNLLLNSDDPLARQFLNGGEGVFEELFAGKVPYLFLHSNPTAENIAAELFRQSVQLLELGLSLLVEHIRIYETPNSWADHSRNDYLTSC